MSVVIQTNIDSNGYGTQAAKPLVDSSGNIINIYHKTSPVNDLFVAYSTDSGANWTEVASSIGTAQYYYISSCIDSTDTIHIIYGTNNGSQTYNGQYKVFYCTYTISGGFTTPETIRDGTTNTDSVKMVSIAVDSNDIPHVAWLQENNNTYDSPWYNNRIGGTWGAEQFLHNAGMDYNSGIFICLDSGDDIYIFAPYNGDLYYFKYSGSWSGPNLINQNIYGNPYCFSAVVDSNDNVYIVNYSNSTHTICTWFTTYTKSTDTWSTPVEITNALFLQVTLGINENDELFLLGVDSNEDVNIMTYNGSWSAVSKIETTIGGDVYLSTNTPIYPKLGGYSTQIPQSGYHYIYHDSDNNTLRYANESISLRIPVSKNYTREENAALPTGSGVLDNLFTLSEYTNVSTENSVYTSQSATDNYSIQQFRDKGSSNTDDIHAYWIGQSNIAPSDSTIYLQVYNVNSGSWETVDSDNATAANTSLTLSGDITADQSNYYDGNLWVTFRIYQLAQ